MSNREVGVFDFKTVPVIRFASDVALDLGKHLIELTVKKPIFITDDGIVQLGLLKPTLVAVSKRHFEAVVYSEVVADPPESNVHNALELALSNGCDGVVGFGGGSSMDVAKLVAALLSQEQSLTQLYGVDQVTSKRAPLIQVPTTAGTGSEATGVAIVTTGESTKAGVVSERLLADVVLLDPLLTVGLPPHITAATGVDAMVHAVEAYTSKRLKNPMSDMLAIKALTLMSSSICQAVSDGRNLDARSNMLLGATMAGQAFANAPVGAVHALAYPLGGKYHIPHGLSNSLVLPHVLRFNGAGNEALANTLYSELLLAIDLNGQYKSLNTGGGKASEVLANYFMTLAADLGLPTQLRQLPIALDDLPSLAKDAMQQQRLLINNPREVSYDDALNIYRNAF